MQPELDKKIGVAHGVSPETVEATLKDNPDAKAVLIINPTYYGVSTDIKRIADIVHEYDIPLIVDEAHGPHLNFNDRLPMSAMEAGADICSQSTHKIIGSINSKLFATCKNKFVTLLELNNYEPITHNVTFLHTNGIIRLCKTTNCIRR